MRPLVPLLLVLIALPLAAQPLPRNEFTLSAGRTDFNGSFAAPAYGISYSRFWSNSISTRVGAFTGKRDFPDERGGRQFRAIYADVELHLRRAKLVSPRIAAGVARASIDVDPYENEGGSATAVIGSGGVDFNIRPRFALGIEASYIPFTPNPRDRFATSLNPFTVFASARFRW